MINVFQCEDGTIINMDKFCYVSTFFIPDTHKFTARVEFGECCYVDLKFDKELDRDFQYAKILHHLTGDNPIKKNCR